MEYHRETSSKTLEKVNEIITKSNLDNPDSNLDKSHQICKTYFDRIRKGNCKRIIVRFTTLPHQTLLHTAIKQKKLYRIIRKGLFNDFLMERSWQQIIKILISEIQK